MESDETIPVLRAGALEASVRHDTTPPRLVLTDGTTVVELAGETQTDTFAGLAELRAGLREYEKAVVNPTGTARAVEAVAAESAVVDSDGAPDDRIAEAMRRISRREPAVLPSEFRTSGPYA